ncbi:MAG: pyridoxine 5-phosphate synthase [Flavobacteriaceae bacterium]|jgi:pyridoxine 5-phosphate synthase
MSAKLSVNVNKIATLRNARGGNHPNVVQVAMDCERFGAEGITVHPRPDERHITRQDVLDLKEVVRTEYNVEGYPNDRFMDLVLDVKPTQATLVPDPPGVLTSNAGWDTKANLGLLSDLAVTFKEHDIRSAIFVDTNLQNIEYAAKSGVDRIELYTGPFAEQYGSNPQKSIENYVNAAKLATELGLGINAGHDLSLENLAFFQEQIPELLEVSIGHALIADALYFGLENTVQMYLRLLK